ncbi:CpaD family pilus assembly protein [Novosphingobium cyanobacteriorum]|uniref:CpaD family pilus assembly protein n=1 Tax=Novosphingobium cyanobacteriorum TaxID=3024215 RepID=A0ABT6CEZ2_9SPHN|nr:CpaD family pilus assembly protein [Novosphingobium cyanobacteriorum]MDF8332480.1 CpaD family pilus assembly protein [Novosphingobium cyanobacteriorum]
MTVKFKRTAGAALALSLGLALSACGGMPQNRELNSVNQPVVERTSFVFDVGTLPGGGVSPSEQRRLAGWFDALELGYGDRISIDDPADSRVTEAAIEAVAARRGLMLADTAPVTQGDIPPGAARIVVTRTVASVPGCPNWGDKAAANYSNGTSRNYGCSVNGNLAAMVANKEDLVRGQKGTGVTVVMSASKAIESYRSQEPTGKGGLKEVSSKSGGN